MTTTVLVTGANRFAGSHVLEALMMRKGLRPIAACRRGDGLVTGFSGDVREGDLRDETYLEGQLSIVHLLEEVGVSNPRAQAELG